jgi:CBS domain-containing protein
MDRARLDQFISQRLVELPLVQPIVLSPNDSVRTAVARMREAGQSGVLTIEDGAVTGIFTERDVLMKCMGEGFDWDAPLASVLTPSPRTIPGTASVAEAIVVMHQHHYRTLPVTDDGRVIGLIRAGDILGNLVEAYPEDVLNLPPRPHQVMEKREGG